MGKHHHSHKRFCLQLHMVLDVGISAHIVKESSLVSVPFWSDWDVGPHVETVLSSLVLPSLVSDLCSISDSQLS